MNLFMIIFQKYNVIHYNMQKINLFPELHSCHFQSFVCINLGKI